MSLQKNYQLVLTQFVLLYKRFWVQGPSLTNTSKDTEYSTNVDYCTVPVHIDLASFSDGLQNSFRNVSRNNVRNDVFHPLPQTQLEIIFQTHNLRLQFKI